MRLLQALHDLCREPFTLKTDGVHAVTFGIPGAHGLHEGHHVLGGHGEAPHERMVAHAAELVDCRKGSDVAAIAHFNVTRQSGTVSEDVFAPHMAVVGDVGTRHQEVSVTHGGEAAPAFSAPVKGAAFPDHVPVPNLKARGSTFELQVLGTHAKRGVGIDIVVFADFSMGADNHMAAKQGAGADHGVAFDHAKGAHNHALAQPGLRAHHTA